MRAEFFAADPGSPFGHAPVKKLYSPGTPGLLHIFALLRSGIGLEAHEARKADFTSKHQFVLLNSGPAAESRDSRLNGIVIASLDVYPGSAADKAQLSHRGVSDT